VSGLKVFKSLGLTTRDANGALIAVDDPRLDPIWAACGRLGMPVLIHTADPVAFFSAPDECNERWMQLQRHPSWSFHGPAFPSRDELFAQRDRMITRHPGTTFICAHVGSHADDLAAADRFLTAHPNAYVDISGRVGALGRQPFTARAFLIEHQDRVIYGTDRFPGRPDQPRYRIYFRFLETADEYFDYYDHPFPPAGDWRIYGVDLPDDVLRKIYYGNSDRILPRAGG
jgi:predicted TIM-barrel fold metal-dependent hydrolase